MSEQVTRLEQAFAALGAGDGSGFAALFAPEGQWLAVPGSGFEGQTPI